MKLHEVLENITDDDWFRPVAWRSNGVAFCIKEDATFLVPSAGGGFRHMTTVVKYLSGEWEIVSPDDVLIKDAA